MLGRVALILSLLTAAHSIAAKPLKVVETIAPPAKFGPWVDLQASSGVRNYVVSVEIVNGAPAQVHGEVRFWNKDGAEQTMTFADGVPARFTTGNAIGRIRVRVKTGGPTGAGVRITQQ